MYKSIMSAVSAAKKRKSEDILYIVWVPEDNLFDVATEDELDTFYIGLTPIATV